MNNQKTYSNKSEYISANFKHLNAIVKLVKCCLSIYVFINFYVYKSIAIQQKQLLCNSNSNRSKGNLPRKTKKQKQKQNNKNR